MYVVANIELLFIVLSMTDEDYRQIVDIVCMHITTRTKTGRT